MSIRAFALAAATASIAIGSFSIVPAYAQTPTPTPTPSVTATSAPTLTKFEGPNLTVQGCDVRVDYALDPAVRIELWRKVNDGDFEQQFHPQWYWTDSYEPGDVVTWKLKYGDQEKTDTVTVPQDCASATPTPSPSPSATPSPSVPPGARPSSTPSDTGGNNIPTNVTPGLAATGAGETGTASITITINGTRIDITAPGGGEPIITTNGEAVTPSKATPKATPTAEPTPESTPEPTQEPAQGEDAVADEIFRLTNEFRAANGLAPFERSECLDGTADGHAVTMATTGYRHATDEEMDKMGQKCPGFKGENIATGYEDAAEVFRAWETSTEGHREAMLDDVPAMGVGVEYDGNGQPFYVQHFGTNS